MKALSEIMANPLLEIVEERQDGITAFLSHPCCGNREIAIVTYWDYLSDISNIDISLKQRFPRPEEINIIKEVFFEDGERVGLHASPVCTYFNNHQFCIRLYKENDWRKATCRCRENVKMNNTKIKWCDRVYNPVTGCLHDCEYCYARGKARRFAKRNTAIDRTASCGDYDVGYLKGTKRATGELHDLLFAETFLNEDGDYEESKYPFCFDPTLPTRFICMRNTTKKPSAWDGSK